MSEKIVQQSEEVIKGDLKELVRGSMEETLNELLKAETGKLTQAAQYECNEQRQGYRSGHYSRNLTTTAGDVSLKVPKLKGISFETAISELNKKAYKLGGTGPYKVGGIYMSMWTESICGGTGAESMKMWRYWWQLR